MGWKSLNLLKALLLVVVSLQLFRGNDAEKGVADENFFLEYHFHTYFDVNDPAQVAKAIELRNEIIAKCVAKQIIAIPMFYKYNPAKPVLESKIVKTKLHLNKFDNFCLFSGEIR